MQVMSVLWGEASANQCQQLMALLETDVEAAVNGRLDMGPIKRLAGMGTDGVHKNNV